MQPYLLAFCERKVNGITRSVFTAVARVGLGKTLFATCKHVLTQAKDLRIVDENGTVMTPSCAAIPSINPVLDLAFVYIRHDVPADRIRINDASISKGTQLTHARNRFGQTESQSPFVFHSAVTRQSPYKAELGFSGHDNDLSYKLHSPSDLDEARRAGVQTFYRVLEMESWTGVSGSALWDKFDAIRGVVCGGDSPDTRQPDNVPRLVYIPAKTIAKEVRRILQDQSIRRMMGA